MSNRHLLSWCARCTLVLAAGAVLAASSALPAHADPPVREGEELLVLRRGGSTPRGLEEASRALGAEVLQGNEKIRMHRLRVPSGQLERVKRALERRQDVVHVEENRSFRPEALPDDPLYTQEWHLPQIFAEDAWNLVHDEGAVVIAVLDTGVYAGHPDLSGQLVAGTNTYDGGSWDDQDGHGTKVAGTAAAASYNAQGVASVAWLARIMPIRVTDNNGLAWASTLSQALTWAADHGARVANISFEGVAGSATVRAAAQYFVERGGLVFAAAGNTGGQVGIAETPWIVSVSATDQNDQLASFSSWGDFVDVSAPGKSIRTTLMNGSYGWGSGTSYASPVAAGVAALMFTVNPALTPSEAEDLLESTADDLGAAGWDPRFGHGRVNAAEAVYAAWSMVNSTLPACMDGLDNDGDGQTDYPEDTYCTSPSGPTEGGTACGLGFEAALLLPLWWTARRRLRARRAR